MGPVMCRDRTHRPASRLSPGSLIGIVRGRTISWRASWADASSMPLIDDLHGRAEQVSRPALGDDELRLRGVALDLPAQAQNLDVDRAVVHLVVVDPARLEQLIAREDPLGGG